MVWLEARAARHGGKIGEAGMTASRKGWHLGEERFKDKLLGMVDTARVKIRKKGQHSGGALAAHNQREAEWIIRQTAGRLGLPVAVAGLANLCKGDPVKVTSAALVGLHTAMPNDWIAAWLAMGEGTYASALVNRALKEAKSRRAVANHERALDTERLAQEE